MAYAFYYILITIPFLLTLVNFHNLISKSKFHELHIDLFSIFFSILSGYFMYIIMDYNILGLEFLIFVALIGFVGFLKLVVKDPYPAPFTILYINFTFIGILVSIIYFIALLPNITFNIAFLLTCLLPINYIITSIKSIKFHSDHINKCCIIPQNKFTMNFQNFLYTKKPLHISVNIISVSILLSFLFGNVFKIIFILIDDSLRHSIIYFKYFI